jgi:hypothetical protein
MWIWEQTAIISLYNINWLVFITETECVYCAVRTEYLCFMWIWKQTAIISLYNINWLVFITENESVCCAVRTEYLNLIWVTLNEEDSVRYQSTWEVRWRDYVPFSSPNIIPPTFRTQLHLHVALNQDKWAEPVNLPESNALLGYQEALDRK